MVEDKPPVGVTAENAISCNKQITQVTQSEPWDRVCIHDSREDFRDMWHGYLVNAEGADDFLSARIGLAEVNQGRDIKEVTYFVQDFQGEHVKVSKGRGCRGWGRG